MTPERKPDEPSLLSRFASDEQAATSVEYVLIAVIVAVPLLASLGAIQTQLSAMLNSVAAAFVAALS
jgi:Flp pilus assembly pilin Flp